MTKEQKKAYDKVYLQKNKERISRQKRAYRETHKEELKAYFRVNGRKGRIEIKIEVLSHYGPNRKLQCAWENCEVVDMDMLTLDHVNDNGALERKILRRGGANFYRSLKKKNYPSGYQTLCANHQLKKELVRRFPVDQGH